MPAPHAAQSNRPLPGARHVRRWLLRAIRRYQANGGGMHYFRVACNFEPSCSEYTHQAIAHAGVRGGLRAGWARIRRCSQRDIVRKTSDPYPVSTVAHEYRSEHV